MKALHVKDMAHSIHMPHVHGMGGKMSHLVHDQRFWAVLAMVLITAFVITLAVLTRNQSGMNLNPMPLQPYYPFTY